MCLNGSAKDTSIHPEQVEVGAPERVPGGRWVVAILAGTWSLFQLSLPFFIRVNSDLVRAIHLGFAISLVFVSFPALGPRSLKRGIRAAKHRFLGAGLAYASAALAAAAALYYAVDYVGVSARQGTPIFRDYLFGIVLVILLLEAARRALGPALPIIASLFIGICFLGPDLPGFIAFRRVSPAQMMGQLTMSTEGIYGIPLYVSASMVFLFVLLGAMLEKSGGGKYFVQLAFSVLGGFRGGPAKAAVLASGLTGLVSGSSIANTVTTGTFTIPLMKRAGYPPEKAAAVEVAASTNGQLMPPIMGAAAFIIAERCNMQYLEVVRAAFIPAVVSYCALIYITHLEAAKLGLAGMPRSELPAFGPTFVSGIHFLIPLGLLVFLLVKRFSPEMAAFWAIVSLAALIVVRDQVLAHSARAGAVRAFRGSLKLLWDSLVAGGRNMMGIGVAVGAAGIIVGVMTLGPGSLVTELVQKLAGNYLTPMLLVTAVISLILGMGLPTTANYIVVSTLVAPAILTLSGNAGLAVPLIAAHLFCFFFGILADDTPPVGLAAYAASAIAKSHPIRTGVQGFTYDLRTALLPFMFFFNTDLLLWEVESLWRAAAIFFTALLAMFAFASAIQGWFVSRSKWYESIALGGTTLLLLRPGLLAEWAPAVSRSGWQMLGVLLMVAVFYSQRIRSRGAEQCAQ